MVDFSQCVVAHFILKSHVVVRAPSWGFVFGLASGSASGSLPVHPSVARILAVSATGQAYHQGRV